MRVNDAGILADVARRLPPGSIVVSDPEMEFLYSLYVAPANRCRAIRRFHLLFRGSGVVTRTLEIARLLEAFEGSVRTMCALGSRELLFLRSAVVAWNGRAVIILGPAGSGKTTLAAEMARCGAQFFSDGYCLLDPQGRVHPYGTGPSLTDHTENLHAAPARSAVLTTDCDGIPVTAIVMTRYRPGVRFRPRLLTGAEAAIQLLPHTPSASVRPRDVMVRLPEIVADVLALKGDRGEAATMARTIVRRLERRAQVAAQGATRGPMSDTEFGWARRDVCAEVGSIRPCFGGPPNHERTTI